MKDIIKGIIVGLGKIIPGVSGSILAISLGIYEKCINSFLNITKDINNIIFLFKISIGILISIILGSHILYYFFYKYYSYIIFIFLGLIMGSVKEVKFMSKKKYWYISIICFFIMYIFSKINFSVKFNNNYLFLYFISGFIESLSSIIPGVSGTALLMSIGMYDKVLYIFAHIYTFYNNFTTIIPFAIGIVMGLIVSIKLISILIMKFKNQMNNAILGITYSNIIIMIEKAKINIKYIPIYMLLFVLGYFSIKKVNQFF